MASLKTNVLLNFLNTFTSIVFPVITFPYATRVLLIEGIGLVNFYGSLVNYLTLFSGIGIQMYASKEVAKYRDDVARRNQCTVEIALLGFTFCLLGYVAVGLIACFVPEVNAHWQLFVVLSLSIFFTAIGMDWFYRAIEAFTFITVRAVVFRTVTAACLFIFVHSPADLLAYCVVTVSLSVGNNVINFVHLRKYIQLSAINWRGLHVWRHLPQTLKIFIPNLVTNMYGHLNIVMLGLMQAAAVVGIYSAGSKLVLIVLTVITSLSIVLLPRSSNLIQAGRLEEFRSISLKSVRLVLAIALPCAAGMALLARPLVVMFCGAAFESAFVVVACTAPVLVLVGLSNIIGIQILYSQGKEKIVVGSLATGVVLNFLLNLWLIPLYGYTGAALSMVVAEAAVLGLQLVAGRRCIPFSPREVKPANFFLGTLLMGLAIVCVVRFVENAWAATFAAFALGVAVYALTLYLSREPLFRETLSYATSLARRHK